MVVGEVRKEGSQGGTYQVKDGALDGRKWSGPNSMHLIERFRILLSKRPLREEEVCESKLIFPPFFALASGCSGSVLFPLAQTFSNIRIQFHCCSFTFLTVTFPNGSEVLWQEENVHSPGTLYLRSEGKFSTGLPNWQLSWCWNQCDFVELFSKKFKNIINYVTWLWETFFSFWGYWPLLSASCKEMCPSESSLEWASHLPPGPASVGGFSNWS